MADPVADIQRAMSQFVSNRMQTTIVAADVVSVADDAGTCQVRFGDGLEDEARLRAAIDGNADGFLLVPEVGSSVLVGRIGSGEDWVVIATSKVAKVIFKKGTTAFQITGDGLNLGRNGQDLKQAFHALINALKTMTVTCATAGSPSSIPLNGAAFDAVKTQIDELLK